VLTLRRAHANRRTQHEAGIASHVGAVAPILEHDAVMASEPGTSRQTQIEVDISRPAGSSAKRRAAEDPPPVHDGAGGPYVIRAQEIEVGRRIGVALRRHTE